MNICPTDLRISTHTATCSINTFLNLHILAKYLEIDDNIKYIEYGDSIKKGENMKQQSKKAKEKKRVFFNQITIIIKPKENRHNNVKLFNNGAVSMTGLKNFDEGKISIGILLERIKKLSGVYYSKLTEPELEQFETNKQVEICCKFCSKNVSFNNVNKTSCGHYICKICSKTDHHTCAECGKNLVENAMISNLTAKIKDYNIVLINSDYYLGFEIKRNVLHELLVNKYNIFSSYEPCIYPGVNSKFYYNEKYKDMEYRGKCYCDTYCNGKGTGNGNGQCKKITVAIFQSGSIIITGARNMNQIKIAHSFINKVIDDNYSDLKKDEASFLNLNEKKKVIKLKKLDIVNYPSQEQIAKLLQIGI